MAQVVFISYASEDKIAADAVCAGLEQAGIRCWIAPRNINPAEKYDKAIIQGINSARVLVLIFSANIFQSQFVESEVERAFSKRLSIIPFRIENVLPQGGLELFLSRLQWMDAFTPPLQAHIPRLATSIQEILAAEPEQPQVVRSGLQITRPPEPDLPPQTPGFIGRSIELARYSNRISASHLAIICGMPGIGKTALAARLARQVNQPDKIFWHTFHSGESLSVLIWKLAGFLDWRGQPEVWQMIQGAQQTGSPLPPAEVLIDYLFQIASGKGYLLCFDNFHFIENDPLLAQFVQHIESAAAAGSMDTLIISSRQPDAFSPAFPAEPLRGLNLEEARQLLSQPGLSLPDGLLAKLYEHTQGNVQFLALALEALKHTRDAASLIDRLSESENIEDYLIKAIDAKLSADERSLLEAVAVFLGYPASREAVSAVLGERSVRRGLNELASRYLLTGNETGDGKVYSLTAVMQAFYYDLLSKTERKAMHRLAGEFYSSEEMAPLQAAIHFQRAGADERAITAATSDVWAMLNLGQAHPLQQVLNRLNSLQRDPMTATQLDLALGQVAAFLGESQSARQYYETAIARLAELTDEPAICLLRARLIRGLGELLEGDEPHLAVEWLQRGLDCLASGVNPAESAALRIRLGRVHVHLSEFTLAENELQQGLAELPPGPSRTRITALGNLGIIACIRGDRPGGLDYFQQVLEIARQINDRWSIVENELNIGIELDMGGQFAEAARHYQEALQQAQQLGSLAQQARALSNLGILHIRLGNYELADEELTDGIGLARQAGVQYYLVHFLPSLADLRLRQGQPEAAAPLLAEAERLARDAGVGENEAMPEIYRLWALVHLAQNDPASALEAANHSLDQARQYELEMDEGVGLRVLGQVQLALGQQKEALASLEQSLALLESAGEPYEAACTNLVWGDCLLSVKERERGLVLLKAAEDVFEKLGALRDVEAVKKLEKSVAGKNR